MDEGRRPFDWRVWCVFSAAAGFLTILLCFFVLRLVFEFPIYRYLKILAFREFCLLLLSALLSLPAFGQQSFLRQTGVVVPFFYAATVVGGWVLLSGAIEGPEIVAAAAESIFLWDREFQLLGQSLESIVTGVFVSLGAALTGFLQGCAMPRPIRRRFCLTAPIAAVVGIALTIAMFILSIVLVFSDNTNETFATLLASLAMPAGCGLYAAATGWSIRRGLRQTAGMPIPAVPRKPLIRPGIAIIASILARWWNQSL
ncbi:MAG: hypothetical protein WD715_02295 [Dongiaceae bacterium]